MLDLLRQIRDEDIDVTVEMIRRANAGLDLDRYPQRLVDIVSAVPLEARGWFDTVLCVRSQQVGHDDAWRQFAKHAFRESPPDLH
jgi:hypothetical protein